MHNFLKYIIIFIISLLLVSCSNSLLITPIEKDKHHIGINFGGPIVKVKKVNLPIPLSSVSHFYGIDTNLTLVNNLQIISAIFRTFHYESGLLFNIYDNYSSPIKISLMPYFSLMTNFNLPDTKIYPACNINFYHSFDKYILYTGTNFTFELSKTKAFNQKVENHILIAPYFGTIYQTNDFTYSLELKYLLPNISNKDIVVDYLSFGSKGAIGIYFSFGIKL
ncbi:MAG TPA: hypothetical protein PLI27_02620 [Ignavibacteriales bacterium]|nr:hypothetical protein [Ignavibacteriales bacterium]HPD66957.1 hypothetical protein [Ignavibacteriales bacterium]HRR19343.1 hypothetical protein [Ignavibacteriales bacterium]